MDVTRPAPTDLAGQLTAVRRGWWLVLAGLLLGLVTAGAVTAAQPRTYQSTTSVLVLPTGGQDANAAGGRTKETINLDTEAQLVRSTAVAERARALLRTSTAGDPADAVTVSVPPNSTVMQIVFTAGTPADARAGSHAFAIAYLANRADGAASANDATATALRDQISTVTKQLRDTSAQLAAADPGSPSRAYLDTRRRNLSNQLDTLSNRLSDATAAPASPGRIISDATLPASAASPSVPVNLAAGLVLGLFVGLAAAFLLSRLDHRVRNAGDLRRRTGVRVLAELPAPPTGLTAAPGERIFSRLRNELVAGTDAHGVIAVIGTGPAHADRYGAGVLVAANLAAAFGRAGTDTVLVDTAPATAPYDAASVAAVPATPGLADVLDGIDLAEALHRAADEPNLWVLTPGTNADRLPSEPVRATLRRLRDRCDQVVVAAPNAADGPDAQTLASLADAAVLAVELRTTRYEDVLDVADQLRGVGTPLLGAVLLPPAPSSDVTPPEPTDPAARTTDEVRAPVQRADEPAEPGRPADEPEPAESGPRSEAVPAVVAGEVPAYGGKEVEAAGAGGA
ncbi:MAG TPA: Wzz/FepE/Etk N-terminal domain-containing protein [Actinocatenispora sp.]